MDADEKILAFFSTIAVLIWAYVVYDVVYDIATYLTSISQISVCLK